MGLDLARGLAILGMVIVHFLLVTQAEDAQPFRSLALLDGRPTALFMLLAGIGITLMARRRSGADPRLDTSGLRGVMSKRGLFLLLVGYLNLILWPGDILRIYGVIFLLGSLLLVMRTRSLLLAAGGFMAVFMILLFVIDYGQNWDWSTLTYENLWTLQGSFRNLMIDGFRSVFPWAGVLILGMTAGRLPLRDRRLQWTALVGGLACWALAEISSHEILDTLLSHPDVTGDPTLTEDVIALFGTASIPPQVFFMGSAVGLAIAVTGLCLLVTGRGGLPAPLRALAATGQMAFTWYLGHVYFGVFVIYGVGWTTGSEAVALTAALAYFTLVASLSSWWRSKGRRGPMEALFRRVCG